MGPAIYYVEKYEGRWLIKFNDRHHGPYPTKTAAVTEAVNAANRAVRYGRLTRVLVEEPNGGWRSEPTSEGEPHPPAA